MDASVQKANAQNSAGRVGLVSENIRTLEILYPTMNVISENRTDMEQSKSNNVYSDFYFSTVLKGGVTYDDYEEDKSETSSSRADKLKELKQYAFELGTIEPDAINDYYSNTNDINISDIGLKPLSNISNSNNIITFKNPLSNLPTGNKP